MKILLEIITVSIFKPINVLLKRCYQKRRFPIDRDKEKELPIFQYPTASKGDRRVYAWGYARTGALGIHVPKRNKKYDPMRWKECVMSPKRITFAELYDVTHLTCGYGFSAYAIKGKDCNRIFGTGLNSDSQVGYHDPRKDHPLGVLLVPAPIYMPFKKPETTKVLDISAGRAHMVIVTDNEGTFTLGNNSYGQCGRKIIQQEDYKKLCLIHNIKHCNYEKITGAYCGQDHSMFITENGNVFACGWGSDGQLGNGKFGVQHQLTKVLGDIEGEKIIKLSCSSDCVLALSDKGQVFGWGNTEYAQLDSNDGTKLQQNVSRALRHCDSLGKIVDIASGGSFCIALNERGEVFSWGFGILGVGPEVQQSKKPLQIPSILFANEFNPGNKVISVNAGLFHSAAVNNAGELFMWGKNKYGCLGLGHVNDQFFPLRVAIGAKVLKANCGPDHTVAICKPFI